MKIEDRPRERLEVREYTVNGRTVAVSGFRFAAVWTDTTIAQEHIHLMATTDGRGVGTWSASQPQPGITHQMPDPRDYQHTERHLYRVLDVRCPKFVRQAFDLFLDDLKSEPRCAKCDRPGNFKPAGHCPTCWAA
jgi:hypothetical protein